jgi:putative transposase
VILYQKAKDILRQSLKGYVYCPALRRYIMSYSKGSHTVFHHRYHIVWAPKYRYKVLTGKVRERVRDIIRQVCDDLGVTIISAALSTDHVHMFVEIPPHVSVSDFMQRAKGRSSGRVQQEFPELRRRYTGDRGFGRAAISVRQAAISPTILSFNTLKIMLKHSPELQALIESTGASR